ncbi:MAG: FISUMP domain-containing protein [Bacteroidota bacterium]|nr:FISUMP domain-containing protein [Bacteroidota bacterium]
MKKIFTILAAVLLTATVWAQSPEKMSYQAVVRDASDNLITNTDVGMQISILQGLASGTAVYVETQTPTTNANGLVSIEIGAGTVQSGDFITIDWANDTYFIKTETDLAGGANYTITGTSQLLSVPYALHAKTAETVTDGITETDPVYSGSEAANIDATDITNLDNLSGTNTGDQDISGIATNEQAIQDTASQIRTDIPDVTGLLSSEADPVYGSSVASGITGTDTINWNNKLDSYTETQNLSDVLTESNDGGASQIKNIADPTDNQDAVTKAYIDQMLIQAGLYIKDIDGNVYEIVTIGDQVWMAENLKVTQEVNGTAIDLVTDDTEWANLGDNDTDKAYCYYMNSADSAAKYGALYTYAAAKDACPTGWHLPSDAEWTELTDYLAANGHSGTEGTALKATSGWNGSGNGTDDYDFSALPGGYRYDYDGAFDSVGNLGYWWSSTESSSSDAYYRYLYYNFSGVVRYSDYKSYGFSVRCVRD